MRVKKNKRLTSKFLITNHCTFNSQSSFQLAQTNIHPEGHTTQCETTEYIIGEVLCGETLQSACARLSDLYDNASVCLLRTLFSFEGRQVDLISICRQVSHGRQSQPLA